MTKAVAFNKTDKVPFTLSDSESESEKDQRTIRKDKGVSGKHQRKFSLSLSLSVNGQ